MADDSAAQREKLSRAIAELEAQQRELGLDLTIQIAHLRKRLGEVPQTSQTGSGAAATTGGVAGGVESVNVGGNVIGDIYLGTPSAPKTTDGQRESYLNWLIDQVGAAALTGVDPENIREETRRDLDLAAVYTALMTRRTETAAEREMRPDRDLRRLSALAALNTQPRLALLGDPGSDKSTFVKFVACAWQGSCWAAPKLT